MPSPISEPTKTVFTDATTLITDLKAELVLFQRSLSEACKQHLADEEYPLHPVPWIFPSRQGMMG